MNDLHKNLSAPGLNTPNASSEARQKHEDTGRTVVRRGCLACYGSGKDSSGDVPTERIRENVL